MGKYIDVKDLKEMLNGFNDNDIIVMSSDEEGNNYSPLSGIFEGSYQAESERSGEIGLRELKVEDIKNGYSEDDLFEDGINAIVLYPRN